MTVIGIFGHGLMSDLSPLSGVERTSSARSEYFRFYPTRTSAVRCAMASLAISRQAGRGIIPDDSRHQSHREGSPLAFSATSSLISILFTLSMIFR
jgi:hypothetical protein